MFQMKGTSSLFSSSENSVPNILRSRSAKSRLFPKGRVYRWYNWSSCCGLFNLFVSEHTWTSYYCCSKTGWRTFRGPRNCLQILKSGSDLKMFMFKGIRESLKLIPNETIPVLFDVMRSILQSPNNTITLDTYDSLVSTPNNNKKEVIKRSNMVLTYNERVECHSRLVKRYFEMLFNVTDS